MKGFLKRLLRVLEALLFCAALFAVVFLAKNVLERKASSIRFDPLLERAQEYDVLFVGDSLMVNGVFPMELWEDYGIAAYNMSSYGNTLAVTYWTMMNALDYADPELIVVGVKDVDKPNKLTGSSSDVHTALDCYPLSLTKIRAVEDLMSDPYSEDDQGNRYADMKWEYYFTLGKYHGRWNEIGESDFRYDLNIQKGGEMAIGVADYIEYTLLDEWVAGEEIGEGYVYLRRIIEECQSRGIDVLLINLPYPASEDDQWAGNSVQHIADEYGVKYIDFVTLDHVVDYAVDCYDANSHLNPSGARKVTDYLGRYIADHYGVPDRRGNEAHARWETDLEAYLALKRGYIDMEHDFKELMMLLHDKDFSVRMAISADACAQLDEVHLTLLHNIVREHVYEADDYSKWSNSMFPLWEPDWAAEDGQAYYLHVDRSTGTITEYVDQEADAAADAAGFKSEGDVRVQVIDAHSGEVFFDRGLSL